ncbi:MAG: hypothetical protein AAF612_07220 [Planctomycetota bacterium]
MSGPASGAISIAKGTGRCAATGADLEPGQAYFAALVDAGSPATADNPAASGEASGGEASGGATSGGETSGGDASGGGAGGGKPATVGGLALQRVDVSAEAWAEGYRPPGLFGYWKTVAQEGEEPKTKLDAAALTHLLRTMTAATESPESDDPDPSTDDSDGATSNRRAAFLFLVALLLVRKRMLRLDEQEALGDGGERWTLMPKRDPSKGPMSKWDDGEPIVVVRPALQEDDLAAAADELAEVLDESA